MQDSNQDIAVTLVQADLLWENPQGNLAVFDAHFKAIANHKSDLVVLPEMFTTGFSMSPEKLAEPMNGLTVEWLKNQAKAINKILVGSVIIKEGGHYYNRLLVVQPNGAVDHYDKKHLFRYAGEDARYSAGDQPLILEINGWKIAFYICYDLRFPVWSRNIDLKYDLAIYIANWPQRRNLHWQTLLKARAIENQAYVIGVNRVGVDGNGINYSGESVCIDPKGESITHITPSQVQIETAVLSKNDLLVYRDNFPAFKDADPFSLL